VARELGIHPGQIYNWRRQYNRLSEKQVNSMKGVDYSKDESEELRKLLGKWWIFLKEENEFLKKATAYFSKPNW
jgi:transposase